jgi:predicted nucleic acid-binding protein
LGNDSADLLIAATTLTHGLKVATRNVQHFAPTGVDVIDHLKLDPKTPLERWAASSKFLSCSSGKASSPAS